MGCDINGIPGWLDELSKAGFLRIIAGNERQVTKYELLDGNGNAINWDFESVGSRRDTTVGKRRDSKSVGSNPDSDPQSVGSEHVHLSGTDATEVNAPKGASKEEEVKEAGASRFSKTAQSRSASAAERRKFNALRKLARIKNEDHREKMRQAFVAEGALEPGDGIRRA